MADEEKRKEEFLALQKIHDDLEKFKRNERESDKKINKLLQASHMLISVSLNLFSEAEDLLSETGFALDRSLSKAHFYFDKAANNYCREFSTMIRTEKEKEAYWLNLQELEKKVRKWAGLEGQHPIWYSVKDGLPEPGIKVIVLTSKGNYGLSSTYLFNDKVEWKGSTKYTESIVAWMPIPKYDL